MLDLRPICENCAKALPPESLEARICSFECTFCADCAERLLGNACPNCGGGFAPRPIRPAQNWSGNNCLKAYPATTRRHHKPVDLAAHALLLAELAGIPPQAR